MRNSEFERQLNIKTNTEEIKHERHTFNNSHATYKDNEDGGNQIKMNNLSQGHSPSEPRLTQMRNKYRQERG